ncbi:MAG: DUF4870 domain-containing protein [Clostridiales bacterium]|nr:DUF4870 domain-containing protein [Clostridiales bacterium]
MAEEQKPPLIEAEPVRHNSTWGMLCHLTSLAAYIGIPFGHILGPLIVWLIKKDEDPFVDDQGKESLNFQISMTLYILIAALFIVVLIGILLVIALVILHIVLVVIASIRAYKGELYRYPLTIRFIK